MRKVTSSGKPEEVGTCPSAKPLPSADRRRIVCGMVSTSLLPQSHQLAITRMVSADGTNNTVGIVAVSAALTSGILDVTTGLLFWGHDLIVAASTSASADVTAAGNV